MSYHTVKVELECFQIHSLRIYLLMNDVTYVLVKSSFFLIISRLLNLKYNRITICEYLSRENIENMHLN